jgi:hypothetical protein
LPTNAECPGLRASTVTIRYRKHAVGQESRPGLADLVQMLRQPAEVQSGDKDPLAGWIRCGQGKDKRQEPVIKNRRRRIAARREARGGQSVPHPVRRAGIALVKPGPGGAHHAAARIDQGDECKHRQVVFDPAEALIAIGCQGADLAHLSHRAQQDAGAIGDALDVAVQQFRLLQGQVTELRAAFSPMAVLDPDRQDDDRHQARQNDQQQPR